MNPVQIKKFLEAHSTKRDRTIVIVDFANVDKWKNSLGWSVGIQELANLIKNISYGKQFLRRFYYGENYGPQESTATLLPWSKSILEKARMNRFELVTKRVKYIHSADNVHGYEMKCDLDVEMAVDLIRERDNYDSIFIFSGDGDLAYVLQYLHSQYGKEAYVFGARGHFGKEIIDAKLAGTVKEVFYADDFEYRLSVQRRGTHR
ncbi:MAG TPA: NYN domain-containing protein [Candidatus Saccharimonadales bacterium]|nr:NYN domain-containing protein [Candidatus Saccharimonadales bacterium]